MYTHSSILLVVVVVAALLLSGCGFNIIQGSGTIASETREVRDFTAVAFPSVGDLTIEQGETESLTIETDENLLPYIQSTVGNGVLTIRFDDRQARLHVPLLRPSRAIHYTLVVKSLNDVTMSGAGVIHVKELTTDKFTLTHSGAGNINVDNLQAGTLAVHMSGAGDVTIAGHVNAQTADLSGFGNYQAGDLESDTARVSLSGAGSATVWVHETLNASLSGVGSVRYYGSPQTHTSTSGVGNVQGLGEK